VTTIHLTVPPGGRRRRNGGRREDGEGWEVSGCFIKFHNWSPPPPTTTLSLLPLLIPLLPHLSISAASKRTHDPPALK